MPLFIKNILRRFRAANAKPIRPALRIFTNLAVLVGMLSIVCALVIGFASLDPSQRMTWVYQLQLMAHLATLFALLTMAIVGLLYVFKRTRESVSACLSSPLR